MFTAEPARLDGVALSWWTGPWPVDERWWESEPEDTSAGRMARAQVLIDGDRALLLCYRRGRWYTEGVYE